MEQIWIYGDESGTMPAFDSDAPFVAALLVASSPLTEIAAHHGSTDWLVGIIHKEALLPAIAYVKPQPGFGCAFAAKTSLMDTMARAKRLVTGRHAYLPERGLSRRDYIWIRATQQALLQATLSSLFRGPISKVSLTLDRKSLAGPTERFMRDRVDAMIPLVKGELRRLRTQYPEYAKEIDRCYGNLRANAISFEWGTPKDTAGLWLAHRLARLSYRELMGQTNVSLFQALGRLGYRNVVQDVTDSLTRALPDEAVARWRSDTGLPVPKP